LKNDTLDYLRKNLDFWDKLNPAEQQALSASVEWKKYSTGQNVHSASHECVGVLLIKSGELRTYIMSEDGREITLFRVSAGEVCILSASCILQSISFDVFVDAVSDTEVLIIGASCFAKLMEQNVHAENFSLKAAAELFSEVMWTMEQILFMSFDKRLAIFLLDETSRTGSGTFALTHEQIAKYMGSAREVVSRMLKYFEKEGLVRLSRGTVEVINKEKLRTMA